KCRCLRKAVKTLAFGQALLASLAQFGESTDLRTQLFKTLVRGIVLCGLGGERPVERIDKHAGLFKLLEVEIGEGSGMRGGRALCVEGCRFERSGRLMHRLSTRFEIRRNALIRKKGQMCLRVRIALAERGCKICVEGRERCKLSFKRSLFLGDLRYSGRNACEA